MLRRTKTYWSLMVLFIAAGLYSFWLFYQWISMGGDPGADMGMIRRNAYLSLFAGIICMAGAVGLTVLHNRKTSRDI